MATPIHHENKPSSAAPLLPPPIPSQYPTRKRLLYGSPSNSTSFESSSLDQLPKRITRNLPNLSDCHGCGTRINHTNPKDRLQTLDSYWRIVLLCKKCIKFVNSAHICTYCFKQTVDSDCFTCGRCKRCIHKECVLMYDNSSPWSYSCKERGSLWEFSVCIDCWVPKLLKNSKGCKSFEKAVSKSRPTGNDSKISSNDYDAGSLEKFADGANAEAKKNSCTKEKEKALRKVVAVKNVMDATRNGLELAANKETNGNINGRLIVSNSISSSSSSSSTNAASVTKNVNDAELALQLHHPTNISPQIPKDLHLTNTNNFRVPKARELNNVVSKSVEFGKVPRNGEGENIVVYRRTRLRGNISKSISEASVGASIDLSRDDAKLITNSGASANAKDKDTAFCIDLSRDEHKVLTYNRTRFKRKRLQENDRDDFLNNLVERCNFGVDSRMVSESQSSQQDHLTQESILSEMRTQFPVKCDGDVNLQADRCNVKEDRYLVKYSRKCVVSKPGLDCQTSMHGDASTHELHLHEVKWDGNKEDRYTFKYSKRRIGPISEFQTRAASMEVNMENENHNMKEGRYLIKYSKKRSGSKLELDHERSMHDDPLCQPKSDLGLPRNHVVESRTSSDASMISSVASVQACASVNVSSPKDL